MQLEPPKIIPSADRDQPIGVTPARDVPRPKDPAPLRVASTVRPPGGIRPIGDSNRDTVVLLGRRTIVIF